MSISRRRFLLICVALPVVATLASAQVPTSRGTLTTAQASRYLSIESGAYDAITRLRERGLLGALDPLAQPYRRDEIARALTLIPAGVADTAPRQVAHWMKLLRTEMAPELRRMAGGDSVIIGFDASMGWRGSTSNRLDPLLPTRDTAALRASDGAPDPTYRGWLSYGLGGWAEYGRFAVDIRLANDNYLRFGDPEGRYQPGIAVLNRTDNAYLSASFANGSAFVGRMRRNWAPLGSGGLMVSSEPRTYPQLGFELGGKNLVIRTMVAELDTLRDQDRYFLAHHIEYRRDDFAISIGEAKVYVTDGGMRLASLNPVDLFFFSQDAEPGETTANSVLNGALWMRRGRWSLSGEALLDDIHVQDDRAPIRGALSGGIRFAGRRFDLAADYRVVSAFAYWTFGVQEHRMNVDQWSYFGRGLGDNHSDYDRLSVRGSIYPVAGLRLTPTVQLQRKGEADFRMPAIPFEEFQTKTPLFLGVRETTWRAALAGRYEPSHRALLEWDLGVNRVDNASHVDGKQLTELAGMVRLHLTWSAPGVRGR
jgi:hypothetical protein